MDTNRRKLTDADFNGTVYMGCEDALNELSDIKQNPSDDKIIAWLNKYNKLWKKVDLLVMIDAGALSDTYLLTFYDSFNEMTFYFDLKDVKDINDIIID